MKKKNKKGLSANAKWSIALIIEIVLIVVLGICYVNNFIKEKYNLIDTNHIDKSEIIINEGINPDIEGFKVIALFGVDSRDGSLREGNRTDSIMLACINNETKEVKIVSVYRDTFLELQEDDGNWKSKVNAAYAFGGPKEAINTLNANLDLEITEYITVDFIALTKAIDLLGGVYVDVEYNELDVLNMALAEQIAVNGIYSDGVWESGNLLLNGAQATAYARIRSTGQGDITRTERQREVLAQMVVQAKKSNVNIIVSMIDDVFPHISTSITQDEMMSLAKSMFSYEMGDTIGFPIEQVAADHSTQGSILVPVDLEQNVISLHRFLFETEEYTPSSTVKRISDSIINETGVYGNGPVLLPNETVPVVE